MENPRMMRIAILGMGASAMALRIAARKSRGPGALSDAVTLGYAPENAVPIAGQAGFPDSSGVDCLAALKAIVHPRALSSSDVA